MFEGCVRLKKVTIPESVTYIGKRAFEGCFEIRDVKIPHGVISIESEAFAQSNCGNLFLSQSITYIADDAFNGCRQLHVVETVPNSYAGDWALKHGYAVRLVR